MACINQDCEAISDNSQQDAVVTRKNKKKGGDHVELMKGATKESRECTEARKRIERKKQEKKGPHWLVGNLEGTDADSQIHLSWSYKLVNLSASGGENLRKATSQNKAKRR